MNRFELTCWYRNYSWTVNYAPKQTIYCQQCKDPNIKVVDKVIDKVDYYIGATPFPITEEVGWSQKWDV